jgi:hypothetical protein
MSTKRLPSQTTMRRITEAVRPVAVFPDQRRETIELRRGIREAFHDSKARTIKKKDR